MWLWSEAPEVCVCVCVSYQRAAQIARPAALGVRSDWWCRRSHLLSSGPPSPGKPTVLGPPYTTEEGPQKMETRERKRDDFSLPALSPFASVKVVSCLRGQKSWQIPALKCERRALCIVCSQKFERFCSAIVPCACASPRQTAEWFPAVSEPCRSWCPRSVLCSTAPPPGPTPSNWSRCKNRTEMVKPAGSAAVVITPSSGTLGGRLRYSDISADVAILQWSLASNTQTHTAASHSVEWCVFHNQVIQWTHLILPKQRGRGMTAVIFDRSFWEEKTAGRLSASFICIFIFIRASVWLPVISDDTSQLGWWVKMTGGRTCVCVCVCNVTARRLKNSTGRATAVNKVLFSSLPSSPPQGQLNDH